MAQAVEDARSSVDALIAGAGRLPWADAGAALAVTGAALAEVAGSPGLLPALVASVPGRDLAGCESYPCMDKLVLWQSEDGGTRLRLHLFSPGYFDRPHNHRWSFASRILRGRYVQSIYGSEGDVLDAVRAGSGVRPRLSHDERAGSAYFLEHALVHSLHTDVPTVSLVLRGPAAKDTYFTLEGPWDRPSERPGVVLSAGSTRESADERAAKAMTPARFAEVAATLRELSLA